MERDSTKAAAKTTHSYDATTIQVLSGIAAVRKRPAMYIGDTSLGGLHHLVYEVVDNSVDEAMAGFCSEIQVVVHPDNSVTVEDNGRGIPVDMHKTENKPAVEVVMTVLHAGGKFDRKAYKVSGGLHGVGVSVVNALSEWLEVEVRREGKVYHQRYERGKPAGPLEMIGRTKKTGTKVTFRPDDTIFEVTEFDSGTLGARLKELAFLNAGVRICFVDERKALREDYRFDGGLASFVQYLTNNKKVLFEPPHYFRKVAPEGEIEVAFQYHDGFNETILSFANNVNTREGGTHLTGLRAGMTRAINEYGKNNGFLTDQMLQGEDIREGLAAVVSVKIPEPQFEGQTKAKLGNSGIRFLVEGVVSQEVLTFLEEHPEPARAILNKCILTAKVREAARKARDLTRKKLGETGALPGKLADCSIKDPDQREIFIVEGDSAGGSAKQGRDRMFQAILPLKGKIINTEKAALDKVLNNDEIKMIISAIGAGVGEEFDSTRVRYGKIIIMTDADVDGAHIRTLLLTFFYRQMNDLIRNGFVHIAQPPLYKVKKGKREFYVDTDADMEKMLVAFAQEGTKVRLKKNSRVFQEKELADLSQWSRKLSEIRRAIEMKKISFPEYLKFWSTRKRFPLYWIKHRKSERFLEDDAALSRFMEQQELNQPDLFGKETEDYRLVEIFESRDMEKVVKFLDALGFPSERMEEETLTLEDGDRRRDATIFTLFESVMDAGKRGVLVQRYKGLGEMNPEQLWETTMDPVRRRLLRVSLEDAAEAERMFTVLMGEEVEPRRQFIERYAREVRNLDI